MAYSGISLDCVLKSKNSSKSRLFYAILYLSIISASISLFPYPHERSDRGHHIRHVLDLWRIFFYGHLDPTF